MGTNPLKNCLAIFTEVKHMGTLWPNTSTPYYTPNKYLFTKDLGKNIQSSNIHNRQKIENNANVH